MPWVFFREVAEDVAVTRSRRRSSVSTKRGRRRAVWPGVPDVSRTICDGTAVRNLVSRSASPSEWDGDDRTQNALGL